MGDAEVSDKARATRRVRPVVPRQGSGRALLLDTDQSEDDIEGRVWPVVKSSARATVRQPSGEPNTVPSSRPDSANGKARASRPQELGAGGQNLSSAANRNVELDTLTMNPHTGSVSSISSSPGCGSLERLDSAAQRDTSRQSEAVRAAAIAATRRALVHQDLSTEQQAGDVVPQQPRQPQLTQHGNPTTPQRSEHVTTAPLSPRSANLRAIFLRVDSSHDGRISRAELIKGLRHDPELACLLRLPQHIREGGTRDQFAKVYAQIEAQKGHGGISWLEFKQYLDDHRISTTVHEDNVWPQLPVNTPKLGDDAEGDHTDVERRLSVSITPTSALDEVGDWASRNPVSSTKDSRCDFPTSSRPFLSRDSSDSGPAEPHRWCVDSAIHGECLRSEVAVRSLVETPKESGSIRDPVSSTCENEVCKTCDTLRMKIVQYLSQIADLEESVSRLTAHVASSDQDRATATLIGEHERLHQKEVAELEANISTLTEQDKIHRRRISELERKLHESTRSGTREQHEYGGSANETHEQALTRMSIQKAEELSAAIARLRAEYERRDEKKARTYAHVVKRLKSQFRDESQALMEENLCLRGQVAETLRVIDHNSAALAASASALRRFQRATPTGPSKVEQIVNTPLAFDPVGSRSRGPLLNHEFGIHDFHTETFESTGLSDEDMQALYARVRSTISRKDTIIDQLKAKYREAQRRLDSYEQS